MQEVMATIYGGLASEKKPSKSDKKDFNPYSGLFDQAQVSQEMPETLRRSNGYIVPKGGFYRSHRGLGQVQPLFEIPIEVLANCRRYTFDGESIRGHGKQIIAFRPPSNLSGFSVGAYYAAYAELLLRHVSRLPPKESKPFYRRLEILRFYRAAVDAVLFGYQKVRKCNLLARRPGCLPSGQARAFRRWKARLLKQPLKAAQEAKSAGAECRAWYYGAKKPHSPLVKFFDMKYLALNFSYMTRALPPAPLDAQGMADLISRLTSDPPEEEPGWRDYVISYLDTYAPQSEPNSSTTPSSHAALGYTREQGGHEAAVGDLTVLGMALKAKDKSLWTRVIPESGSNTTLEVRPVQGAALSAFLLTGVEHVLNFVDIIPIFPVQAQERGLKTRYPTCSLTAANLV